MPAGLAYRCTVRPDDHSGHDRTTRPYFDRCARLPFPQRHRLLRDPNREQGTEINGNYGPCSPINAKATPLVVSIAVDGPAKEFLKGGLVDQEFYLFPQQGKTIRVDMKDLLKNIYNYSSDILYGVTVTIVGRRVRRQDARAFQSEILRVSISRR